MDQLLADGIEVQGGMSGRSVPSQRAKKSMTLKSQEYDEAKRALTKQKADWINQQSDQSPSHASQKVRRLQSGLSTSSKQLNTSSKLKIKMPGSPDGDDD